MVAISIYNKGNLHKVPDVPRHWLMPAPKISVKDFRILLHRRSRALARLSSSSSSTTTSSPSSDSIENNCIEEKDIIESEVPKLEEELPEEIKIGEVEIEKELDGGDCLENLVEQSDALVEPKLEEDVEEIEVKDDDAPRCLQDEEEEKAEEVDVNPCSEIDRKEDVASDKEKRRREVEEKLQILTEKKHSLVQVLKQILSAEEELKRRSSMQGMVVRPPVSLHVDTTNDSGSESRLNTPRMGSDGNVSGDVEGGETDDNNHNVHSRHLLRTSSPSPSPDSQHRKSAFNAVQLTPRTNSGVTNSPSRFAQTVQQGHPSNLPSISVSGTNYVTSSPSPAASGGTSAFRDGRISSPWN